MEQQDFDKIQRNKVLRDIRAIVENIDEISTQVNMYDELIKQSFIVQQDLNANAQ